MLAVRRNFLSTCQIIIIIWVLLSVEVEQMTDVATGNNF